MRPPTSALRARGMALFIVLAVLVLISALVIGFFLSTTTELKSSRSYASGAAARQQVDSVTQLVIAQISDATKGENGSSPLAWASQPGMIRTYDDAGSPFKYYKLYSSDKLIVDSGDTAGFTAAAEMPPANWDAMKGLFTDLNDPIIRDSKVHFPIIDPRARASTAAQSVEGFDYQGGISGVVLPGGSADTQRLPMPVRWLYVLQDGKIAVPTASNNGVITFDPNGPGGTPSRQNPIVGRIAFWTDDDTAKVNINTASEGTFWDRPWANTTTEQNFATAIPGQNEFQRFPGHPAKTSLSTVFGSLLPTASPAWYAGISAGAQSDNQQRLKAYYDLAPRVADGGTRGGTVNETDSAGNPNSAFHAIVPDSDRLYASVDEFLFSADRTANSPAVDKDSLEKFKFFLTAHSRAPELNLFGKPRVTLWPLQLDTAYRNAKDKLIAFCSEIAGHPYYFQRFNTYSASNPSASSSQSATLDWTGVPRNQDLYGYLDDLTSKPIPGFGGSFSSKYSGARRQILTEMFDQIRSGVNAYSTGLAPQYSYAPSYLDSGEGQVVPLTPTTGTAAGTHGFGRFSTVIGGSLVFFRSNAAYYTTINGKIAVDPALVTPEDPNGVIIKPAAQLGATLILNPFTVSPGFPPWSPYVQYVVTGLDKFTINGASMGFPASLKNTVNSRLEYSGQANCTPFFGILANFRYNGGAGGDINKTPGTSDPVSQYPFTIPIPPATGFQLPDGATSFNFNTDSSSDHTIRITIYAGTDTALAHPIQTIEMKFPGAANLPVPTAQPTLSNPPPATAPAIRYFDRFGEGASAAKTLSKPWRKRLIQFSATPVALGTDVNGKEVNYVVRDVVRGVEGNPAGPARGDYRAYAGLSTVPSSFFAPSAGYDSQTGGRQQYTNVQSLWDMGLDGGGVGGFGYDDSVSGGYYPHFPMDAAGSANNGGQLITSFSTGVLLPQAQLAAYGGVAGRGSNAGDREYRGSARPAVPPGLAGAYLSGSQYGDWDNAMGLLGDGPFINKPDEGNSDTVSDTTSRANIDVYYGSKEIAGGYFSTGVLRNVVSNGYEYATETGKTFSPNRQVSSAVLFGSLPTGIDPSAPASVQPWRTLLFSPNPLAKNSHPGLQSPPDHLLLDLFTMPIVEPYAISEPFSTAGKVNMNYQIMPFGYIQRDTGVRAVLKATRLMAIPQSISTVTGSGNSYKDGQRARTELRYDINPDKTTGTLAGFEKRFTANDIFRSASEICGIFLVPKQMSSLSTGMSYPAGSAPPSSYDATAAWWDNFLLTGDNTRESPYGDIYSRLTTKSNTYTIHYKVQALGKSPSTPANQWVEGRDAITGEMRGSTTVERYIDLGNPDLPDFANASAASAESFYKIRVIDSTIFNP